MTILILRKKLYEISVVSDKFWWLQQDTRTRIDLPKLDLNVLPVYRAGITGKGVRVTILDDGIEYTHDDLNKNYVSIFKSIFLLFIICVW